MTPEPVLGSLTVTSTTLADGKVTLTVPDPVLGNKQVFKITEVTEAPSPKYDQVLTTGWTDLPTDKVVKVTSGKAITVAEVTSTGAKARKSGSVAVA